VLARIVRASASNIGFHRIMPPSLRTPRSRHCGEPAHPWLLTAFLISSRIFGGIGWHAQCFACSMCHWIPWSTGAFRGISFVACHSVFNDDPPCVDGDRPSVMARPIGTHHLILLLLQDVAVPCWSRRAREITALRGLQRCLSDAHWPHGRLARLPRRELQVSVGVAWEAAGIPVGGPRAVKRDLRTPGRTHSEGLARRAWLGRWSPNRRDLRSFPTVPTRITQCSSGGGEMDGQHRCLRGLRSRPPRGGR
jgi:hypothetical protein